MKKRKNKELCGTLPECPSAQAKASQRPLCFGVASQKFLSLSPVLRMGQRQQLYHSGRMLMPQLGPAYTSARVLVSPLPSSLQPSCPHMVPIGYAENNRTHTHEAFQKPQARC